MCFAPQPASRVPGAGCNTRLESIIVFFSPISFMIVFILLFYYFILRGRCSVSSAWCKGWTMSSAQGRTSSCKNPATPTPHSLLLEPGNTNTVYFLLLTSCKNPATPTPHSLLLDDCGALLCYVPRAQTRTGGNPLDQVQLLAESARHKTYLPYNLQCLCIC